MRCIRPTDRVANRRMWVSINKSCFVESLYRQHLTYTKGVVLPIHYFLATFTYFKNIGLVCSVVFRKPRLDRSCAAPHGRIAAKGRAQLRLLVYLMGANGRKGMY